MPIPVLPPPLPIDLQSFERDQIVVSVPLTLHSETTVSQFKAPHTAFTAAHLGPSMSLDASGINASDPHAHPTINDHSSNFDYSFMPLQLAVANTQDAGLEIAKSTPVHSSRARAGKIGQSSVEALAQQRSEPIPETQPIPPSQPLGSPIPSPTQEPPLIENSESPTTTPSPAPTPPGTAGVIELKADQQEYDKERQLITAEGNVVLRFRDAILDADRVQVNLINRLAVADGNVFLRQGAQLLQGDRIEYNFAQGTGTVSQAKGQVSLNDARTATASTLPTDVSAASTSNNPLSGRLVANQPLRDVTNPSRVSIGSGFGQIANLGATQSFVPQAGGTVNRLRFEAEQIDFDRQGWQAQNIRITNDPFSPPELEVRARSAQFRPISPYQDELVLRRSRLVFDQRVSLPLLVQRRVFDRRRQDPGVTIIQLGYDAEERGGLFVERGFTVLSNPQVQWTVTPQIFVQALVAPGSFQQRVGVSDERPDGIFDPDLYGLQSQLEATISPRTDFRGSLALTSLNPGVIDDNLRASIRLRQNLSPFQQRPLCSAQPPAPPADASQPSPANPDCRVIESVGNYALNLEYSYRDRLFNGSLGFQTVQQSLGGVLTSPTFTLGKTGIKLSYQVGAQYISADTDQQDLLDAVRDNNRVSLGRLQASAALNRSFLLWTGKASPATATEGLRYSPTPVTPYLSAYTGLTATSSYYSSGEDQTSLQATVGLSGQFGRFSRSVFDYTGFNLSVSQGVRSNPSPFLFDRFADQRTISAGIVQQLYGPLRLGLQTSYNLDNGKEISTDYILEYNRRTYGLILRYNPVQQIGSVNILINDFNWAGGTDPFSASEVRAVQGGVIRSND
jgi:hypothetical protein